MKKTALFVVCMLIASCSGIPLAKRAVRTKTFKLDTKVAARTAYHRAIAWLDKNQLPLDGTSMEQLAPEGRIVLKTKSKCQLLSREREAENRFITYKLTLDALEAHVDVTFEDIRMVDDKGEMLRTADEQISNEEQMAKIDPCLTAVTKPLYKGIRQLKINWE